MKLFGSYDSPTLFSRTVMATSDILSYLFIPQQPVPRIPLVAAHLPSLLLLRLDGIGDNVCSWPALNLLRTQLPITRISLAVGPWAAPLYRECPWVDEIIEWDSGLFGIFRGKGLSGLQTDRKIAGELRKRGFSAGIDLRGDLLSILLLRLVAPPVRIATVTRGGKRLLTDPLSVNAGHEALKAYDIASKSLGLPVSNIPHILDWSRPAAMQQARRQLAQAGWDPATPSVALCPQALWTWKQWPKERFRELAVRLKQGLNLQVIWFLENREQADEYSQGDPFFCGPLDQVAAAMSICTLAVSNDSGLMHLAIAAGCRTVQLFGPGDAARFAHHGESVSLFHDTDCRYNPCTRSGDCRNRAEGWCMEKIGVDEVYEECCRLTSGERVDESFHQKLQMRQGADLVDQ